MSSEAKVAADWWADHMLDPGGGIGGDGMSDAFHGWARDKLPAPTAEQVETFRATLRELIEERVVGSDTWIEAQGKGNPQWGGAFRVFGTDYAPDPILADALERAGLHVGALSPVPLKTRMWVNPGQVTVAHGYRAERKVIYEAVRS